MAAKGGLGIGLSALFDDNPTDSAASQTLRLSEIEPNRSQPRKKFDDESISALADSIKRHGILQPLLVRPYGSGYHLVFREHLTDNPHHDQFHGQNSVPCSKMALLPHNQGLSLCTHIKISLLLIAACL